MPRVPATILGNLMGVGEITIQRWRKGINPVPPYAILALCYIESIRRHITTHAGDHRCCLFLPPEIDKVVTMIALTFEAEEYVKKYVHSHPSNFKKEKSQEEIETIAQSLSKQIAERVSLIMADALTESFRILYRKIK